MKKVLLITNIPNPYRIPLFNELSIQMKLQEYKLKVVFGSAGYSRRYFKLSETDFKFDYKILDGETISSSTNSEKTYFLYKGLWSLLKSEKPDTIIVSGFSSATIKVFFWKIITGTKYIIWSGSIERKNKNESIIRRIQRKLLCRFADAFVVYGSKAKEYLEKSGVKKEKIAVAINTVDTEFFYTETSKLRKEKLNEIRPFTFIYLGYLVPRKNVQLLLESVKIVTETRKDFLLNIIGDGSSKASLEKYVQENNLTSIVKFKGFVQKEELPGFFAQSNTLLFQTDFDIWGLVLNEAMAAGLPCVSSVNAGATYDLIQDNINGYRVDFTDKKMVAQKIINLLENPGFASEMGEQASGFIRTNADLATSANGFIKALEIIK